MAHRAHREDILKAMDRNQMFVLALANVPTIITVLIGILLNNGRFNDLNGRMGSFESRLTSMDSRLASVDGRLASMDNRISALDHKFDTRFDLLLSKVVDLDNRLTRIETQRH
jgi:hypothetical protein